MATKPVNSIHYFEIVPTDVPDPSQPRRARYAKSSVESVAAEADYVAHIAGRAARGDLPGEAVEDAKASLESHPRLLDIVARKPGREAPGDVRAYAFRLNARVGKSDLVFFAKNPVIPMPTNFGPSEDFFQDIRCYDEGGDMRWASFVCDLDAVRASPLAQRLRELHEEEKHAHGPGESHKGADFHALLLTLPFCFNLVDSLLGAAPWVVDPLASLATRHEVAGREGASAEKRQEALNFRIPWFTHGGVHPDLMPFLVVEI